MRTKDTIGYAIFIMAIWLGHLVIPDTLTFWNAVAAMVAVPAFMVGVFFRRRQAPDLPVIFTPAGHVFPVKRRAMAGLGWFFALLPVAGALVPAQTMGFTEIACFLLSPAIALFLLISARNVREIRIDDHQISFLPVGASLRFNAVSAIRQPASGIPPSHIDLSMKAAPNRYIPGTLLQWNGLCRLNITGSNADAVLSALRQRLPVV